MVRSLNILSENKMKEKPFFRESNIWRIIGGFTALIGLILMIALPVENYPGAIIYRKLNEKGQLSFLISVWHIVIGVGFLGFFPTLKEWTVKMWGKPKKKEEENDPTPS